MFFRSAGFADWFVRLLKIFLKINSVVGENAVTRVSYGLLPPYSCWFCIFVFFIGLFYYNLGRITR